MPITRRTFLERSAACGTLLAVDTGPLRQVAFAGAPSLAQKILVVIHLRGACDGLNLVCPANDPHLIAARPAELRVLPDGNSAGHPLRAASTPGVDWRLHAAANELAEFYRDGTLAFVHATGIPEANRSHFVATDIIDHGAPDSSSLARIQGGWLARYLAASAFGQNVIPAASASGTLAGEFASYPQALTIPDLANGLPLPWDAKSAAALKDLYRTAQGPAGQAGLHALEAADAIAARLPKTSDGKFAPYLDRKEGYDKAGDIGRGLKTVARLIKLDAGLVAASVDIGGWDTHEGQPGRFHANVSHLSAAVGAFWNDLAAYQNRISIVAYGEFGRRLRANKSAGTDHGRGGVMLVMGAAVKGGRILGPWPGLEEAALDERVDLAVKTDYRHVLTEVLESHGGAPLAPVVFPGYRMPPRLGLAA